MKLRTVMRAKRSPSGAERVAFGRAAIGAVSLGALAIRALAVKRGRVERLETRSSMSDGCTSGSWSFRRSGERARRDPGAGAMARWHAPDECASVRRYRSSGTILTVGDVIFCEVSLDPTDRVSDQPPRVEQVGRGLSNRPSPPGSSR